uniref:Uncharacterized protein n=1 Tax=Setaria italica TaxID=4555 RepID=K4AN68_SETIT
MFILIYLQSSCRFSKTWDLRQRSACRTKTGCNSIAGR